MMSNATINLPYWSNEILEDTRFDRFVITGGLGSSKTTNGLITFLINVLRNPKAKMWWVIAPTYSRIDDSVIPAIVFGMDLLGLKANVHYKYLKSKPSVIRIFATDQEIRFISADRPETMVSATLGGYFITEAFRIKREVYENVESRTRSRLVDRTIGILEGTPEGDTWGKDEFNIDKYDYSRRLRRFILHTHDNAHNLNDGYIPRLFQIYAHNPAQIRSYIYGEFSSFRSGDVFGQFVESRDLIEKMEADPSIPLEICFDFNVRPLTYSVWQKRYIYRDGYTRLREVCLEESSNNLHGLEAAAASIVLQFPKEIYADTKVEIWGDRTGHAESHKAPGTDFSNIQKYLKTHFKNVEVKAPRYVTPIAGSVDIVNKLFLYELALVCDNCVNVRRSFNNTKWKAGKADLEKPQGEDWTHWSDGARYRLYDLYKGAELDTLIQSGAIGFNPI